MKDLSAKSYVKPSELIRYLETKYSNHVSKSYNSSDAMKRVWNVRLSCRKFPPTRQASNEVALEISKQKKTHTIGKNAWNPVCWKQ